MMLVIGSGLAAKSGPIEMRAGANITINGGWINNASTSTYLFGATYGVTADGTTDDTLAIQATINASGGNPAHIILPSGICKTTRPLLVPDGQGIWLDSTGGRYGTTIKKTTNTVGWAQNRLSGAINDSYAVDSIISLDHSDNRYNYFTKISNIKLDGESAVNTTYAIYAPRTAFINIENVWTDHCNYSFFTYDSWMGSISGLYADYCISVLKFADDGAHGGTGTSLTASNCFAAYSFGTNHAAYDIYGLAYSTFIGCGVDHLSGAGEPVAYFFNAARGITMNGCGAEDASGQILYFLNSTGVVNGFKTYDIDGVTGGTTGYIRIDNSKVTLDCCVFANIATPRDTFNKIIQGGAGLTTINTVLPTGGNAYCSYGSGSYVMAIADRIAKTNASGTYYAV